jgi:hypothetical protein
MLRIFRKLINGDVHDSAAIALSKLATGALDTDITIAEANLTVALIGNYADVTVANSDLLTLNSVGKQLVANPGAGYANILDSVEIFYDYSSAAFASNGNITVNYHTGSAIDSAAIATIAKTSFFGDSESADGVRVAYPTSTAAITPIAGGASGTNGALWLTCASADPITGGGHFHVRTFFHVVPTSF